MCLGDANANPKSKLQAAISPRGGNRWSSVAALITNTGIDLPEAARAMSISNDEYTMLVEQLTAVKMEKYELIEKTKKMVHHARP